MQTSKYIVQIRGSHMSSTPDWERLVELQAALHGVQLSPRQVAAVARALVNLAWGIAGEMPETSQAAHV